MTAKDLINDMIPPLKPSDKASKALVWMEELRLKELPVVDQGAFLGFVTEDILLDSEDDSAPIRKFPLTGNKCLVYANQHFYDAVKQSTDYGLESTVVLDSDQQYLGVITLTDSLAFFSQSATIQSPGGIIVLSIDNKDYSLSEISRLIESDNAKVLGSSISIDKKDPNRYRLTLKLNKEELSRIIATLERFGYKVIAHFQEVVQESNEKERLDMLMRYLNI